jgi:hypothetical protein
MVEHDGNRRGGVPAFARHVHQGNGLVSFRVQSNIKIASVAKTPVLKRYCGVDTNPPVPAALAVLKRLPGRAGLPESLSAFRWFSPLHAGTGLIAYLAVDTLSIRPHSIM